MKKIKTADEMLTYVSHFLHSESPHQLDRMDLKKVTIEAMIKYASQFIDLAYDSHDDFNDANKSRILKLKEQLK